MMFWIVGGLLAISISGLFMLLCHMDVKAMSSKEEALPENETRHVSQPTGKPDSGNKLCILCHERPAVDGTDVCSLCEEENIGTAMIFDQPDSEVP